MQTTQTTTDARIAALVVGVLLAVAFVLALLLFVLACLQRGTDFRRGMLRLFFNAMMLSGVALIIYGLLVHVWTGVSWPWLEGGIEGLSWALTLLGVVVVAVSIYSAGEVREPPHSESKYFLAPALAVAALAVLVWKCAGAPSPHILNGFCLVGLGVSVTRLAKATSWW